MMTSPPHHQANDQTNYQLILVTSPFSDLITASALCDTSTSTRANIFMLIYSAAYSDMVYGIYTFSG